MPIELVYRGGSGGAVKSVNGKTGAVVLTADDVGAVTKEYVDAAVSANSGSSTNAYSVEPATEDIPKIFFSEAIPQTKTDTKTEFRYISKTADISGWAEFKAQGNSSMSYAKKNMTVKLYADEALEEKLKVDFKGWGKQRKFCLKANWIDLTHARNIVSARLWGDVVRSRSNYNNLPEELRTSPNMGAIDGFPVKVYSQGVYQGRYTLNIPKDAWMANMNDELETHCILCGENYKSGCFRASALINESDWTDEIHDTVPALIKTNWNNTISFVMNSTDEEFRQGLGNHFDIDSLIDYFIFGVVSCGLDAFGKNQLYMTYNGSKWFATMYDMDSTFGLWWNGSSFVASDYARESFQDFKDGQGNLLYIRLAQLFYEEIQERYAELKAGALSVANLINRFERFTDIAPIELVKEDYASTTGGGKFTGIPSKDTNNIQQIRKYIVDRYAYCDMYMASLTPADEPVEPDTPVEPDEPSVLPAEYTQLDYIESTGTQYIDTGVSGGTNASYEIKFNPLATAANAWEQYFCGAKVSTIPKIYCATSGDVIGIATSWGNSPAVKLKNQVDEAMTVTYNADGSMCVDGVQNTGVSRTAGNGWGNETWYVFNSHGEPALMASMKLYYLKMWTDGELVRDFVPVLRNADNAVGLYDLANEQFYENTGTGSFSCPTPTTPEEPDALAGVNWVANTKCDGSTGANHYATAEAFSLQNRAYVLTHDSTNQYPNIAVYDADGKLVSKIENNVATAGTLKFLARSDYKYKMHYYSTSGATSTMTLKPIDNSANAEYVVWNLADMGWVKAANGNVEASLTAEQKNVIMTADECNALVWFAKSAYATHPAIFRFLDWMDGYLIAPSFTTAEDAIAYFTENNSVLEFNKRHQ